MDGIFEQTLKYQNWILVKSAWVRRVRGKAYYSLESQNHTYENFKMYDANMNIQCTFWLNVCYLIEMNLVFQLELLPKKMIAECECLCVVFFGEIKPLANSDIRFFYSSISNYIQCNLNVFSTIKHIFSSSSSVF